MEYNYLSQQQQMFCNDGLVYEHQQVIDASSFIPSYTGGNKMTLLNPPQSPDPFPYEDTASPSSMLSNTSFSFNLQSFPTPTSSPCQHASETIPLHGLPLMSTDIQHAAVVNTTNTTTDFMFSSPTIRQLFVPECTSPKQAAEAEAEAAAAAATTTTTPVDSSKTTNTKTANSELRRQIHIQSEQKRRAQIKDGFEDLRNELPSYLNKKMSKVALLHRTVQHIQHLKNTQLTILAELKRLADENEQLKKFQQDVLHKQMYGPTV